MNIFQWYDLKLSSFFKMKHKICKKPTNSYKFLFIQKWFYHVIYLGNSNIFHKQFQKKLIIWKSYFGEKAMHILI
jgi:hypothetical protein